MRSIASEIRTPERDPHHQMWERGGAQTKLFDEKVLVEGETLAHPSPP